MARVDLHIHTVHSIDGELPPETIVTMAAEQGFGAIAIADHNRASAVEPAIRAGRGAGVAIIPAIELDCRFGDVPIHVLGYFIDHLDRRYAELWEQLKGQEAAASERRVRLAQEMGLELDYDAVMANSRDGIVTGELIAHMAMMDPENREHPALAPYFPGGARSDNPYVNFYWDFCSKGKPAYAEIVYMTFEEAIRLLRDTGGVAVLAHPGMVIKGREDLLPKMAAGGIVGVEAFSSYHTPEECAFWKDQAARNGLFVTCGSDFHGETKPSIRLGQHGGEAEEGRSLLELRRSAGKND